jgi:Leucine-rich repeat (LRR) protein
MKYTRFFILIFIGLAAQSARAQKITFKDENLKQALLDGGYDRNKDGEIDVSEVEKVVKLDITEKKIKSLDDLVWFKSLRALYANDNDIQNLDVFFNNTVIEEIYIGRNRLGKKLILKNIERLRTLAAFADGLEEIELIGTDNIKVLFLQDNRFEKVGFHNLSKLADLIMSGNERLKFVDISFNPTIGDVDLTGTAITQLDVSNNPLLKILYVDNGVKLIKSKNQTNLTPAPVVTVQGQKKLIRH